MGSEFMKLNDADLYDNRRFSRLKLIEWRGSEKLALFGEIIVEDMITRINSDSYTTSIYAGETLLQINEEKTLPVLIESFQSDNSKIRLWVARIIRNMSSVKSKAVLKEHLKNESDKDVKRATNIAL